jgi:hypothetical protein
VTRREKICSRGRRRLLERPVGRQATLDIDSRWCAPMATLDRLVSSATLSLFEKVREFGEPAARPLVSARDWRGKHTTDTRRKAARISCFDVRRCARIARPTLDGHFSKSSSVLAKHHMGGFRALHDCAAHCGIHLHETIPHNGANERVTKTRATRGQRRQWLCICGHQNASDTVSWPLLPMESVSRAVPARSGSLFKKRVSFSSRPIVSCSGPVLATTSTAGAQVADAHVLVVCTGTCAPE